MTDYEALERALREKADTRLGCPVCAQDLWGFPSLRVGLYGLDFGRGCGRRLGESLEDDERADDGFWPITCLNCGYVRLFHVATLLDH